MNWLARLKKTESTPDDTLQKQQKQVSVVSVGTSPAPVQNSGGEFVSVANAYPDPANDAALPFSAQSEHVRASPPRYSSGTTAILAREIETLLARLALFTDRGLSMEEAEILADRMVTRDQQADERRLCLECLHLSGGPERRRCSQWREVGLINGAAIPGELVTILQRCPAFNHRLEVTG
jgi:hypothetical protein